VEAQLRGFPAELQALLAHLLGEHVLLHLLRVALLDGANLPFQERPERGQQVGVVLRDGEVHGPTLARAEMHGEPLIGYLPAVMQAIALEVAPRARLGRAAYVAIVTLAGSLVVAGLAQIEIHLG